MIPFGQDTFVETRMRRPAHMKAIRSKPLNSRSGRRTKLFKAIGLGTCTGPIQRLETCGMTRKGGTDLTCSLAMGVELYQFPDEMVMYYYDNVASPDWKWW
jgi:hypothetical protein